MFVTLINSMPVTIHSSYIPKKLQRETFHPLLVDPVKPSTLGDGKQSFPVSNCPREAARVSSLKCKTL